MADHPPPTGLQSITWTSGAQIHAGNGNIMRVDFSATIKLEPDSDPEAELKRLREWIKSKIRAEVLAKGYGSRKAKDDEESDG